MHCCHELTFSGGRLLDSETNSVILFRFVRAHILPSWKAVIPGEMTAVGRDFGGLNHGLRMGLDRVSEPEYNGIIPTAFGN